MKNLKIQKKVMRALGINPKDSLNPENAESSNLTIMIIWLASKNLHLLIKKFRLIQDFVKKPRLWKYICIKRIRIRDFEEINLEKVFTVIRWRKKYFRWFYRKKGLYIFSDAESHYKKMLKICYSYTEFVEINSATIWRRFYRKKIFSMTLLSKMAVYIQRFGVP